EIDIRIRSRDSSAILGRCGRQFLASSALPAAPSAILGVSGHASHASVAATVGSSGCLAIGASPLFRRLEREPPPPVLAGALAAPPNVSTGLHHQTIRPAHALAFLLVCAFRGRSATGRRGAS